jgi:thiol-disulfide isomerase/thioredoxin
VGESAPDFEYSDASGTAHKLSDLRGRVVVLNFWATWCVPCREEMPALDRVAREYGDKVVVLGINKLEQAGAVSAFAREIGVGFTLVVNPAGDIPDRYGIRALPTTYVVRPDGTIGQWRPGSLDFATFAGDIQAARQ